MKKQIRNIGLLASLLCAPLMAQANEVTFQSADFDFEPAELLSKVPEAQVAASGDVLYCRADIGAEGAVDRGSCFAKETNFELVIETEKALKSLSFLPAEMDGKAIPVRMSFRVAYTPLADSIHVSLIPNLGTMQAQYGRDYVAPQERLDISDWYQRYSEHSYIGGKEFLGEGRMARVATMVSPKGTPTTLKTVDATKAHIRDADIVKRTLRHSRFIPGTVNGKVVPMEYIVAVHYGDANEAYAGVE